MSTNYTTQNGLLLKKLLEYYNKDSNIDKLLPIINGESKVSLRLTDWFVTNYSKEHFIVYEITSDNKKKRFNVYRDYKLRLKAYSKKRFDPFCRWDRITIPYKDDYIQTTIGQLNFFKWALENNVIAYIEKNIKEINNDMNSRNSTAKNKKTKSNNKTRKKRQELSISAIKSIKKENVQIIVDFN